MFWPFRRGPFAGMALLCLASGAHAQAPADSVWALPLVDVVAPRGTGAAVVGARTVHIGRASALRLGATHVGAALERQGGAFVRRYGPGGLASVSLRGTGASHTAVLLDGLRLTDPQLGQFDLSLLPMALLDGVDVVHGAGSAWHGADAVGGALVLTPRSERRPEVGLGLHADGVDASAGGGGALGPVQVQVDASAERRSGRFEYEDGTRFPAARVVREGADRTTGALLLRARALHRFGVTTAAGWLAHADRGLPGATPDHQARQTDGLARAWATHTRVAGPLHVRLAGWMQAGSLRYVQPLLRLDETGRTRTVGVEADAVRRMSPFVRVRVGATGSRASAQHPSLAGQPAEGILALLGDVLVETRALSASVALRADRYVRASPYTAVNPRAGVAVALGHGWQAKGGAGRSFRAPTLNDRFWRGAGRPDLRPERGWSAEAGLARARGAGRAEVTVYTSALNDALVWQPEGGVWRPSNVQRTRTRGLEASARGARGPLEGAVFVALTQAQDRSDPARATFGQPLRYVPRITARADAAWMVRFPLLTLAPDAALQVVGARPVTADGSQSLPPYALVRAGFSATRGRAALAVHFDNAFDVAYAVLEGYPMPGRQAEARLRFTF